MKIKIINALYTIIVDYCIRDIEKGNQINKTNKLTIIEKVGCICILKCLFC